MKTLSALLIVLVLTACSSAPSTPELLDKAQTPNQCYYVLLNTYENFLVVAVTYSETCSLRFETDRCHGRVKTLQSIETRFNQAMEQAERYHTIGQDTDFPWHW